MLLHQQNVDAEAVRAAVTLPPAATETPELIPFSGPARKALELTFREALRLGHNYIGTEHLLLALLELEDGAGPLHRSGVDKDRVETDLIAALESLGGKGAARTADRGVNPPLRLTPCAIMRRSPEGRRNAPLADRPVHLPRRRRERHRCRVAMVSAPRAWAGDAPIGHIGDTLRVDTGTYIADVTVSSVAPCDPPPGFGYTRERRSGQKLPRQHR